MTHLIGNTPCTVEDWKTAHSKFDSQRRIGERLELAKKMNPGQALRDHVESCGKMDTVANLEAVDGPLPELTNEIRQTLQRRYIAKIIHGNVDGVPTAKNCPNCKTLWDKSI